MRLMFRRNAAAAVVCLVFGILGATFVIIAIAIGLIGRKAAPEDEFFSLFPLIMGGVGAVFLLLAAAILARTASDARKRQAVRARGQLVQATVTNVRQNFTVTVNGRSPYVVECSYQPEGCETAYLLKSGDLWGGCPPLAAGDTVPVYWDDYDKKHYTVDLTGLEHANVVDLR